MKKGFFLILWGAEPKIAIQVEALLKGVYFVLLAWTVLLYCALFYAPAVIHRMLNYLGTHGPLKRFGKALDEFGENLERSSKQMKGLPFLFWVKAFSSTVLAWLARFAVVSALLLPFALTWDKQLVSMMRQLMCWIVMTVSPTPGGSGFSEYLFANYYADLIPAGSVLLLACMWRLATYYLYLVAGFILLPTWIRKRVMK